MTRSFYFKNLCLFNYHPVLLMLHSASFSVKHCQPRLHSVLAMKTRQTTTMTAGNMVGVCYYHFERFFCCWWMLKTEEGQMEAHTGAWIRRRQEAAPWHQSLPPTFFSLQTLCLIWIFSQKSIRLEKILDSTYMIFLEELSVSQLALHQNGKAMYF